MPSYDEMRDYPCYGVIFARSFPRVVRNWGRTGHCSTCDRVECHYNPNHDENELRALEKLEYQEDELGW